MNLTSYRLAVSIAACNVAGVVAYTISAIVGLSPVKNCHITLAMGVLPVVFIFYCNL